MPYARKVRQRNKKEKIDGIVGMDERISRADQKNRTDTKVEECLKENGFVLLRPSGTSMRPLIKTGETTVFLQVPSEPLKKGDIILYKRIEETKTTEVDGSEQSLILHRIVGIDENGLLVCGDHQWKEIECVQYSQVLAVARGIYREKNYIDLYGKSKCLKLYTKIWDSNMKIRRVCLGILRLLKLD